MDLFNQKNNSQILGKAARISKWKKIRQKRLFFVSDETLIRENAHKNDAYRVRDPLNIYTNPNQTDQNFFTRNLVQWQKSYRYLKFKSIPGQETLVPWPFNSPDDPSDEAPKILDFNYWFGNPENSFPIEESENFLKVPIDTLPGDLCIPEIQVCIDHLCGLYVRILDIGANHESCDIDHPAIVLSEDNTWIWDENFSTEGILSQDFNFSFLQHLHRSDVILLVNICKENNITFTKLMRCVMPPEFFENCYDGFCNSMDLLIFLT